MKAALRVPVAYGGYLRLRRGFGEGAGSCAHGGYAKRRGSKTPSWGIADVNACDGPGGSATPSERHPSRPNQRIQTEHSLRATALLNQAYQRLADRKDVGGQDRADVVGAR